MLATLNTKNPKLYARVKNAKTYQEKEIINKRFGNDLSVPQTIYNRIQNNINLGKKTRAYLKIKLNDGSSHWVNNEFTPTHSNKKFIVNSNIVNKKKLQKLKQLYNILIKIEKKVSLNYANKYLDGFLEAHQITFNQLSKLD